MTTHIEELNPGLKDIGRYEYGWADSDAAGSSARRGLSEEVVRDISARKNEPEWMTKLRLKGLSLFAKKPMPSWGSDLTGIDFQNIKYFVKSTEKQATTWDELPEDIKNTYDRLGIPEAEKQRLVAGVAAQYESEVVYHQIREDLEAQGVIFLDTDTALKEHPDRDPGTWPDLVLIDGGAGQLSAARETLAGLGIEDVPLVAIAKGPDRNAGRERIHLRWRDPLLLEPRDPVLYCVQTLRDEAHRFAIGAHRARRKKAITASPLDEVPGIGPARKRALLQHFGSAKAVSRAGIADLESVGGISAQMAKTIYDHFHERG